VERTHSGTKGRGLLTEFFVGRNRPKKLVGGGGNKANPNRSGKGATPGKQNDGIGKKRRVLVKPAGDRPGKSQTGSGGTSMKNTANVFGQMTKVGPGKENNERRGPPPFGTNPSIGENYVIPKPTSMRERQMEIGKGKKKVYRDRRCGKKISKKAIGVQKKPIKQDRGSPRFPKKDAKGLGSDTRESGIEGGQTPKLQKVGEPWRLGGTDKRGA